MSALRRTYVTKSQIRVRATIKLVTLILGLGITYCPALRAQLQTEPTAADMSKVTDVTGGMHYLLQIDDLVMLKVDNSGAAVTTSLINLETTGSSLQGTPKSTTINSYLSGNDFSTTAGVTASDAFGRMYNTPHDTIALLNAVDSPANWLLTLFNPRTGFKNPISLDSRFKPYGTVYTQVVMGDFNGDGLADPLLFYSSVKDGQFVEWGMRVVTATSDPKRDDVQIVGPELNGNPEMVPATGTIVVGDFNGDGRDEIAALLVDCKTIAFYSVDPKTLTITQTSTVKLPNFSMLSGQVALAAGRFRNMSPGVTNADLVVFGQIDKYDDHKADLGYSVIPILNTLDYDQNGNPTGKFTPTVVQNQGSPSAQPYFRFDEKSAAIGALAQAAPLAYWPQQTSEQLVLGIKTGDGASYIEIGTFVQDKILDNFDWESETEREYSDKYDYLQNMWVGNFDNLITGKGHPAPHNAALQIETYEVLVALDIGNKPLEPHINIFDVLVPSPFIIPSSGGHTDWLSQKSDNTSGVPLGANENDPPRTDLLVPGDIQGRSLRLGSPTIARITSQIQPDVVLAIPPMHVDYIAPNDQSLASMNHCEDSTGKTPCVVNISVLPDSPSSSSFATTYVFDSSANTTSKQASTTSWGVSVKASVGESATFNDGMENASLTIKDTTKAAHESTVENTYGHFAGTESKLTITTGFADRLLWTDKELNVYYYPVLGCEADSTNKNCTQDGSSPKTQTYVEFSVPDQIKYYNQDSDTQDWYQPVHEAGNLLSYPWTTSQLESRFSGTVSPLTNQPSCLSLSSGGGGNSASTSWTQGTNSNHSSGSTNSFSNELSMSYSGGVGVDDADGVDVNYSLDIAMNTSLNNLNEITSSTSSSKGITITEPDFGYPAGGNGNYGFTQLIFGLKNNAHRASQDACMFGEIPTAQNPCIVVKNPDTNQQVGVGSVGPLFTGYIATTNTSCSGSGGNGSWWQGVYTKPDIALNHPRRWYWDPNLQKVSFIRADDTSNPADNDFYKMKGFFITKQSAGGFSGLTLPSGPNLGLASANDKLTLTTRVYNYSLKSTTAPVQVRFYGQLYCHSTSESSCTDWKTKAPCKLGYLCGDSFPIGNPTSIPAIGGFNTNPGDQNEPTNWQLASVDFVPADFPATQKGNVNMVFWVVAWMQDGSSGKLIEEMPGHGLTAIPGSNLTQITQVATEEYSNNVGMYPLNQYFQILPAGVPPPGAPQIGGSLKSITVSLNPQISLGKGSKIEATMQATGAPAQSVNVVYYDGDPSKNGTQLEVQKMAYLNPDMDYYHRAFFSPKTCGTHTIYARAWTVNSSITQATATTNVTLDPVDSAQALINSTERANITDATLRSTLLSLLNSALQSFQQGQTQIGETTLGSYVQELAAASGKGVSADNANRLIGQSGVAFGCGPKGFSLSALSSSAEVSAGSTASYVLAVTPSGGFKGAISLACDGAPRGTTCSISSQSVTLDGTTQSPVTITITTTGRTSAAGLVVGPPPSGRGRILWSLMLLLTAIAIALLQRERRRQIVLGCVILLMLFTSGCGSSNNRSTPVGTYNVTVSAMSGSTVQNATIKLIVR